MREYKLTHERLIEVLDYNPETGVFVWKVARSNRVKVGSRAGVRHQQSGGRYMSIDNEKFMAHRLAFFYVNKCWPNTDVRPLDGDYDNCAIANLKEVSRVELAHQRSKQSNNTSGFLGVSRTVRGKWQATITWNYRQVSLGANFESPEAADEARSEAETRLKGAQTEADCARVLENLRIWKGQRTAWRFLNRDHPDHAWESFESFCEDVKSVPVMRYAMMPLDATKSIGPGNYDWTFPAEASRYSTDGIDEHNRIRRERQRDLIRDRVFRKKYGITFAEYQERHAGQNGVCACCGRQETKKQFGAVRLLSVDHDHVTKAVRGLLCGNCNHGIGMFGNDRPDLLRAAADYLDGYYGRETDPGAIAALKFQEWLNDAPTQGVH